MSIHLQKELDRLKEKLLTLSTLVEESVRMAVESVQEKDAEKAQKVVEMDEEIDAMEIEVEEDCLKILALHQPVAIDLRFIVAVLKLNNDLERIGDLAVNIAERTIFELSKLPEEDPIPFDFSEMGQKALAMVRNSLDSLVEKNVDLAWQVCAADQEVDDLHKEMYTLVRDYIRENPSRFDILLPLLSVSRQLERIADHATNIAEDVIYMIQGDIVRHQSWYKDSQKESSPEEG